MIMSTRLMQEIIFFWKKKYIYLLYCTRKLRYGHISVDRKIAGNRKHRNYRTVSQMQKKQELMTEENSRKKSWDTFHTTICPTPKGICNFMRNIDMKHHFSPEKIKKELWGYLRANSHTLQNADMLRTIYR